MIKYDKYLEEGRNRLSDYTSKLQEINEEIALKEEKKEQKNRT